MDYKEIFNEFLKENGISKLYAHQDEAIKEIESGKSVLLSTPTTSGKSIVAYYGILRAWSLGLKSIYVVPLKALAEEKAREIRFFEKFGIKVKVSTGDYDETGNFIKNYDIIITTSEKADSLLRNSPNSFYDVGFVALDEIHNIGAQGRGDTLEILATKFLHILNDVQILAMSATVNNYEEIAIWLNAKVVKTDFRPVPLKRFIIAGKEIYDEEGEVVDTIFDIDTFINETLRENGQTIIFESTRRSAEKDSKIYAKKYKYPLDDASISKIDELKDLPGSEDLLELMKNGIAYHHAGIISEIRNLIEKFFLERKIKVLFATTTLAAGINLPARTVIIKSVYRYDGFSNDPIPNMEIQQMLGRAGRSKYDKIGYGYIVVGRSNLMMAYDKYIAGPLEDVESQITSENLKKHVLGVIASGTTKDRKQLNDFFKKTFLYLHDSNIGIMIDPAVDYLIEHEFIRENQVFKTLPFGRRTSELYIEPETAVILRGLLDYEDMEEILLGISSSPDILPFSIGSNDYEEYYHPRYDENVVKLSRVLNDWINEVPEEKIIQKYNIYPADLRNRVESAEWLVYSLNELGKILHKSKNIHKTLYYRIKFGVKEELIPLVQLPFIGRVRARRLYMEGYDLNKIASANPSDLTKIPGIGEGIAKKIVEHAKKITENY
jgi:Superfamily II helicase